MSRKKNAAIGLVLGLSLWVAASSAWADCNWKTAASGTFSATSNWTPAHYPTSSEAATFNLGSPGYTVTFDNNYTNTYTFLWNDNVTFNLGGYKYTQANGFEIGGFGAGYLTLSGGSMTSASAGMGMDQSSSGTVVVSSTAAWTVGNTLSYVGYAGRGVLAIQGGSVTDSGSVSVGEQTGGWGTVTVDGTSARCLVSSTLTLGDLGSGELFVRSGGQASCAYGTLGSSAGAYGAATVDGTGSSLAVSSTLTVGMAGTGTLAITGGGRASSSAGELGENSIGSGSVTVRDTGSVWNANGGLIVGDGGTGYLTVTGGGQVTSAAGTTGIGLLQGSFGCVTVDGAGSSWTSADTNGFKVGGSGTGSLSITGGGRVSTAFYATLGDAPGGSGNVNVDGAGSLWTVAGSLNVGNQGAGTLTITGGGRVTSIYGSMGQATTASPTATVRGFGSAWVINSFLNFNGPGTLTIDQGGAMSCTFANLSASGASASVADRGSTWTIRNDLNLGTANNPSPATSLSVSGGGTVAVAGTIYVYPNSTFTLDGGTVSAGTFYMPNSGALATVNDGWISVTQSFTNHGELRLGGPSARITTPYLFNYGLISGTGRVEGMLDNIGGSTITVAGSDHITVAGPNADFENYGTVNLVSGGTVESLRGIVNGTAGYPGIIAGQGTLATGPGYHLENTGSIAFTAGQSNVLGDLVNDAGGSIIVSGGGAATFYGKVTHNGTQFKVSQGSSATFLGLVNGAGNFTGTGTTYFEGGYSPGNSPASVTFEGNMVLTSTSSLKIELGGTVPGLGYDTVSVGHTLTLGGTLDVELYNGFRPNHNDAFQVLSWGTRSGAFDSITGLDLGSRLHLVPVWNSNNLTLKAVQGGNGTWGVDAPGAASLADNWTGGLPNGVGDRATFGAAIHAPRQVTVDTPTVLGAMVFASGQAYTVAGPGTLTLQAATGHATIGVSAAGGSVRHVISAPVALASALDITAAADTTLRFEGALADAAGLTVTKIGDGTLELAGSQAWGTGSLMDVFGGTVNLATDAGSDMAALLSIEVSSATVNFDANQHLNRLIIGDGGTVVLRQAGVVVVNDLQIGGFDFGQMVITPEPATLGLLAFGGLALMWRRPKKHAPSKLGG